MVIDDKTLENIAHLARLEFVDDEKDKIKNDLSRMLSFIDQLNELDTSNVEPLIYMSDRINVLREDEVRQEITQKEALKNAPLKDSDYFKVPKTIEGR
jgi:aspartyl-tRNA(Asn)/glutamyl-tRNA(Gln) amidotransferase subunit C